MTHRLNLQADELKLLMLTMGSTAMPGAEALTVTENTMPTLSARDSLVEKGIIVRQSDGQFSLIDTAALIVHICLEPRGFLHGVWYAGEEQTELFNIYFQKKDIVLLRRDNQNKYELLWVPTLPLAAGGLLNFMRTPQAQVSHEMGAYPWLTEAGESWQNTLKRFMQAHAGITPSSYTRFTTEGGDSALAAEHYYMHADGVAYMAAVDGETARLFKPDQADAAKALSKWMAYTHRACLMEEAE